MLALSKVCDERDHISRRVEVTISAWIVILRNCKGWAMKRLIMSSRFREALGKTGPKEARGRYSVINFSSNVG